MVEVLLLAKYTHAVGVPGSDYHGYVTLGTWKQPCDTVAWPLDAWQDDYEDYSLIMRPRKRRQSDEVVPVKGPWPLEHKLTIVNALYRSTKDRHHTWTIAVQYYVSGSAICRKTHANARHTHAHAYYVDNCG